MSSSSSMLWRPLPQFVNPSPVVSFEEFPSNVLREHVRMLQEQYDAMQINDPTAYAIQQEIIQAQTEISSRPRISSSGRFIGHNGPTEDSSDENVHFLAQKDAVSSNYQNVGMSSSSSVNNSLLPSQEISNRKRKRNRNDGVVNGNSHVGLEPKASKVNGGQSTVSSSSSGSPLISETFQQPLQTENGLFDGLSTPNTQRQISSDEELARHLHNMYQNGYSPDMSAPFLSKPNFTKAAPIPLLLPGSEVASPLLQQSADPSDSNSLAFNDNVIYVSDDDDDVIEIDGNNFQQRVNNIGANGGSSFYSSTIPTNNIHNLIVGNNRNASSSNVAVNGNNNHYYGFGAENNFFPFAMDPPKRLTEPMYLNSWDWDSSTIIDTTGRVLNGGWEVPGQLNKLPGAIKSYADYVSNDPTKTLDEIKSLLENIRPDMEIPPENREGTPDALVYPLMEHQKVGLAWLKQMEDGRTKGGILADDMGLGKTIQTLALLVSRPSTDPKCKTTLIVAPVALLRQWEREIKRKLKPNHQLSVLIYHGSGKKTKSFSELSKFDVILTTYGTIGAEFKRLEQHEGKGLEDRGEKPKVLLLDDGTKFYRVVIDEAQCVKNKDTQSSKGCSKLRATYRLCLSGTPMQNSCDELFSLLRFLRVKPYHEWSNFSQTFSRPLKGKSQRSCQQAMNKLQALLKAILLRRTKSSEIDGHPILTLPSKEVRMVYANFSPDEQAFYTALETKSKIIFNKYMRQDAVGKNYSNILVLLLRLRQACCHPHLINDFESSPQTDPKKNLELVNELAPDVVTRIKSSESLECPVCLDVSENPSIVIPCGHLFCKECLIQVQTQHEQSNLARGEESSKLRCPGCRGHLDPQRITDLKAFKVVYPPDGQSEVIMDIKFDNDLIYDTEDEEDEEDEKGDEEVTKYGDLRDFVVLGSQEDNINEKQKGKQKVLKGRSLTEVRKDAMRNEKSKRQYQKYLAKRWIDSAKVSKSVEIIQNIQKNDPTEKTIVFSQFTSLLDLLEVPISQAGISYRRYDGGMSANKRNQALLDFQDDGSIKVLLVSLKAGNSGLNLVAASQVIIFDPFYNPFVELQAIDRAHRIGQQRPVVVHRLVVAGTIEDRVLELQEQKKNLIDGALDENAQRGIARLTARDLGFLFGIDA